MIMEPQYAELRAKMQVVKDLYSSRHYTQCARLGERLLAEAYDEIHPIHLACLHFYTALSRDTLVREATLKNRFKELNLAEKHYIAAIAALTPPFQSPNLDDELASPLASPTPSPTHFWTRRSSNASSFDSTLSAASSATSYCQDEYPDTPKQLAGFSFPRPPRASTNADGQSKHHSAFLISSSMSDLEAATSSFLAMLDTHLASVRALKAKTAVQGVRFMFPKPETSPMSVKPRSSWMGDEEEKERVWQSRMTRVWRKRFDPDGVRRLCGEVLGELR